MTRRLPFGLLEPTMTPYYIFSFVDIRVRRFHEVVTLWRGDRYASKRYRPLFRGNGNELLYNRSYT